MRPSREELDDLYNKQRLNTYQIADLLGCAQQTISKWLIREGLNHQKRDKLTYDEMHTMYAIEKLSTRQIATKTGFCPTSIKNWLREYGIERRPASIGMVYHGIEPPSHEILYHLVHIEHKSYQEIGAIYGIDKAAISHWMKKYDIPRPDVWVTRNKGSRPKPSKEELSVLYDSGLSLTAIGEMFGYSYGAMANLCRKYGIEVHPDGWDGGKRYLCQDGHLVRSVYEQRVDDWLFAHNIAHVYEPHLPWHTYFDSDFLANGWYIEVWGVTNNEAYKQRSEQKRQLYQQHNAPLIELPYYFFAERQHAALERRLSKCLAKPFL